MASPDLHLELIACPPWVTDCPNLALAYLSTYLRSAGYRTRVRDLNAELRHRIESDYRRYWNLTTSDFWSRPRILEGVFSPATTAYLSEFIDSLLSSPAPILAFSCQSANVMFTLGLLEVLRERGCEKLVVFGGPSVRLRTPSDPRSLGLTGFRPSGMDEQDSAAEIQRHLDRVDVFVEGEGEETLLEVVTAFFERHALSGIPGALAPLRGTSEPSFRPRPQQPDLDRFPAPTFEEFDLSIYDKPILPFLTSRGCVRKCAMCYERILWPGFRHRSVDHIVREMRAHMERFGINLFSCNDLLLNGNLPHLGAVADAVAAAGLEVKWWGNAVVHRLMDRELFRRMKAGGIAALVYGIESGSQKILRKMKKGYLVADADHVMKMGAESGILNVINLMVGFPGEDDEDHELTMEFVRRNHEYIHEVAVLAQCIVYPNSPLAEQAEYYGLDPQSLLQLNPFTVNTTWRDLAGMDEATRKRRFWELHRLLRGYGLHVVGVEDEEELGETRLNELCGQLSDPTMWVREEAMSRLKRSRNPRLVPDLVRALEDESFFVVGQALMTLSRLEPERGWHEAARLIRRRTPLVDRAAMIALAALDRPETFEYMQAQLARRAWERADSELKAALAPFRRSYEVFERYQEALDGGLTPDAAEVFGHPCVWVRRRALSELLHRPEAVRALAPHLLDPALGKDPDEEVRFQRLERVLGAGLEVSAQLLLEAHRDLVPRIRALAIQGAATVYSRLPPGAPPGELAPLLAEYERAGTGDWTAWFAGQPDPELEYRALIVARRAFEPGAGGWGEPFIAWALACPHDSVRSLVLDALRRSVRPGHEAAVLAHLAHPVPMLRRIACEYLGNTRDRRHEQLLARMLGDPDMWVAESAGAALGRMESPLVLRLMESKFEPRIHARLSPWLQEGLAGCRRLLERARSLAAAIRSGEEELLLAAFGEAGPFERVCILHEVAAAKGAPRLKRLVERGLNDSEDEVRLKALEAISASGDASFGTSALPRMDDPCGLVRARACRFLATVRYRPALDGFLGAMSDPEPQVKEWAARGVGRLRDPELLPMLAELVSDGVFEKLRADIREDLSFHRELAKAKTAQAA